MNYGGVGDGFTENTDAFTKAIADCSGSGGGSVIVPSGVWLTGPITLRSNINLHLEKGALILFSPNRDEYKKGANNSSLITGSGLHNVAVTGEGLINGSGEVWRPVKKDKMTASQWKNLLSSGGVVSDDGSIWAPTKELIDGQRPLLLDLQNCKSVLLDGPTLENSPSFAASISRDQDVVIRNTEVNNEWWAQNGDGLDLTSSQNVLLYNCTVTVGDDAIAMKSSGTPGGTNALENVVIADCVVYPGHGGFVAGSNTSGDIRNIYVQNCNYIGTDTGIKFKSYVGGGGTVENIYFNNIHMKDIQTNAIDVSSYYQGHNAASDNAHPRDAKVPARKRGQTVSNSSKCY